MRATGEPTRPGPRRWLAPTILAGFVAGMLVWGQLVHAAEPRWARGQTIPRQETHGLLETSLTGLSSAHLRISLSAPTDADIDALVDLTTAPPSAELAVDLHPGAPADPEQERATVEDGTDYRARLVGHTAYLRPAGASVWSRLPLRADAHGPTATFLAQVAGGIDLEGLMAGAQKGLQHSTYTGTTRWHGRPLDTFELSVAAHAIRSRLPALLTQDSDRIHQQVACTLWLDHDGHLAGFRTVMNGRTVTVLVTGRNPDTSLTAPARSVPFRESAAR